MNSLVYPSRLRLAQLPTPLEPLDRYSAFLGGPRIWLKRDDLTGSLTGGNKVRKLEFTFSRMLDEGCTAVISCGGVQSNHCRATAVLAAKLGIKCTLILRGEAPKDITGNILIDHLVGADVHYIPADQYYKKLSILLQDQKMKYAAQGIKAWIIPTGASDGVGIWGYIQCAEELQQDFIHHNIHPSHIFHATGSGGTQAGLSLGAHCFSLSAQVVGINVCDDEAYFMRKVRQDMMDWKHLYQSDIEVENVPVSVLDGYVGEGYAKASPDVFNCIKQLASLEGVILDPVYTGKAFYALTQEIKLGRYSHVSDIVFVHTGGIFGVFPYANDFSFHLSDR